MNHNINWWWLSYSDEEKGFLGAAIVIAPSFLDACIISTKSEISPRGEVLGGYINSSAKKKITLFDTMRLLNKKEATELTRIIDENN